MTPWSMGRRMDVVLVGMTTTLIMGLRYSVNRVVNRCAVIQAFVPCAEHRQRSS